MLKIEFILIFLCAQIFFIHCYSINHIQRSFSPEFESELNDELFSKLLHTESLLNEVNPSISSSALTLFDQTDAHPRTFQKRGRQCLWKVCSWALDKRSLHSSSSPSSTNSVDSLAKLLY